LFYATLCHTSNDTPYIIVYGEKGKAIWTYDNDLNIEYEDGTKESFSYEKEPLIENMYYNLIDVIKGEESKLLSSIEDCRSFMLASNGAFESSGRIFHIPDKYIIMKEENGTIATYIKDIEKIIKKASQSGKLFSELPVEWAVRTKPFSLEGYKEFNLF